VQQVLTMHLCTDVLEESIKIQRVKQHAIPALKDFTAQKYRSSQ